MMEIAVCHANEEFSVWVKAALEKSSGHKIRFFSGKDELKATLRDGYKPALLLVFVAAQEQAETEKELSRLVHDSAVVFVPTEDGAAPHEQKFNAQAYLVKSFQLADISALLKDIESLNSLGSNDAMKIYVRKRGHQYEINCPELVYVESEKHEIILHLQNSIMSVVGKLDDFEIMLRNNESFLRCHQSFIVNMDYVESAKGARFFMKTGDVIPIRKLDAADFKAKYLSYTIKAR